MPCLGPGLLSLSLSLLSSCCLLSNSCSFKVPPSAAIIAVGEAIGLTIPPVPDLSSSVLVDLTAPKDRAGNSLSSSRAFGIGIGPDIVPRIDLLPAFTRLAFAPDFHMLGISSAPLYFTTPLVCESTGKRKCCRRCRECRKNRG